MTRGASIIRYKSAGPVVVSTVAGVALGAAAFGVTRLTGLALFTLVGAVLGAGAPFLSRRFRGRVRMDELTLTASPFGKMTFVVDDDARMVAWRLYVEVTTRVSTQPLGADDGLLRESLTSLYGLFTTTREALKASRPSVHNIPGDHSVEHFAIRMLNYDLRPFLSSWHPRLKEFEDTHPGVPESAWPDRAQCRADLARVTVETLRYAECFAELAGVQHSERILDPVPEVLAPGSVSVPAPVSAPAPEQPIAPGPTPTTAPTPAEP